MIHGTHSQKIKFKKPCINIIKNTKRKITFQSLPAPDMDQKQVLYLIIDPFLTLMTFIGEKKMGTWKLSLKINPWKSYPTTFFHLSELCLINWWKHSFCRFTWKKRSDSWHLRFGFTLLKALAQLSVRKVNP